MKLNKKGLTNEEIQNLIEEHVKWKKFYKETIQPVQICIEIQRIWFEALRKSKVL